MILAFLQMRPFSSENEKTKIEVNAKLQLTTRKHKATKQDDNDYDVENDEAQERNAEKKKKKCCSDDKSSIVTKKAHQENYDEPDADDCFISMVGGASHIQLKNTWNFH